MPQKILMDNGANIDALDNSNETALMKAACNGHLQIVKVRILSPDSSGIE